MKLFLLIIALIGMTAATSYAEEAEAIQKTCKATSEMKDGADRMKKYMEKITLTRYYQRLILLLCSKNNVNMKQLSL